MVFSASPARSSITASGASLIAINSGNAASVVPMTITGPQNFSATISTNGGAIILRPTGDLEFEKSGILQPTTINLNAGSGLVDIQAAGNVTVDNNVTLSTNSPIQINL